MLPGPVSAVVIVAGSVGAPTVVAASASFAASAADDAVPFAVVALGSPAAGQPAGVRDPAAAVIAGGS